MNGKTVIPLIMKMDKTVNLLPMKVTPMITMNIPTAVIIMTMRDMTNNLSLTIITMKKTLTDNQDNMIMMMTVMNFTPKTLKL